MRFRALLTLFFVFSTTSVARADRPPVERLGSLEAPVLYIWMDGPSYRNLLAHPSTPQNIFVDSRTVPVYAWHTPLGALAESLVTRTNLPYGTVLVKVVLEAPLRVTSVARQPVEVPNGEIQYHVYALPRRLQLHEWIFSADSIKEWSAFTPELLEEMRADLDRYQEREPTFLDKHLFGVRFDRKGTIRAARKIIARFERHEPIRRVKPVSTNGQCEVQFTPIDR
jgi:hypothetical protein